MNRLAIVAVIAACIMCACSGREHSRYSSVGPHGWLYTDTIAYLDAKADTVPELCDVAIAVRHNNGYEFSNIWVELSYSPMPDSVVRDTLDIRLADDLGRWLGTGIGVGYQKVDTVLHGASIDLASPILLRHIMRADTLPAIEQAGIVIIKAP